MSLNPTNLDAVTAKVLDAGGDRLSGILQPADRVELTNNAPVATAVTNSSPFGFATADQGDDLIATVIQIRAALITLGLLKDDTANAD